MIPVSTVSQVATRRMLLGLLLGLQLLAVAACRRDQPAGDAAPSGTTVTVYTSVDEAFARTILDRFSEESGIEVEAIFDSEAGKTTGLVQRIRAEKRSGGKTADVFWSGELFNTILMARDGLLEPYDSPVAADIPPRFRDIQRRWTAVSARGRALAFDPDRVKPDDIPTRWEQLAEEQYASITAFANPLFGTTRGHVAAMFAVWGEERARKYLTDLHEGGVLITDGNSTAVRAVIDRRVEYAATDSDDIWVAQKAGHNVAFRFPDMGDGGALLIPCSVAMIKDCAHPEAARRLVDFLVSPEVERMLALSDSHNVPVRESLRKEIEMTWPPETKAGFNDIADALDESEQAVREILIR